ncbi:YdbH domain-containing protein [Paraphotobacterium marinum]|uniref:intermembrane phospholipid transport protein YdbH family protein n=1 Tax=Paraphotobacterium marinum TaxID=1755811 RepID=UPI0039E98B62
MKLLKWILFAIISVIFLILFGFSIFAIYLKTLGITIEGFSGISYDKKSIYLKTLKLNYDGFIVDSQKIKITKSEDNWFNLKNIYRIRTSQTLIQIPEDLRQKSKFIPSTVIFYKMHARTYPKLMLKKIKITSSLVMANSNDKLNLYTLFDTKSFFKYDPLNSQFSSQIKNGIIDNLEFNKINLKNIHFDTRFNHLKSSLNFSVNQAESEKPNTIKVQKLFVHSSYKEKERKTLLKIHSINLNHQSQKKINLNTNELKNLLNSIYKINLNTFNVIKVNHLRYNQWNFDKTILKKNNQSQSSFIESYSNQNKINLSIHDNHKINLNIDYQNDECQITAQNTNIDKINCVLNIENPLFNNLDIGHVIEKRKGTLYIKYENNILNLHSNKDINIHSKYLSQFDIGISDEKFSVEPFVANFLVTSQKINLLKPSSILVTSKNFNAKSDMRKLTCSFSNFKCHSDIKNSLKLKKLQFKKDISVSNLNLNFNSNMFYNFNSESFNVFLKQIKFDINRIQIKKDEDQISIKDSSANVKMIHLNSSNPKINQNNIAFNSTDIILDSEVNFQDKTESALKKGTWITQNYRLGILGTIKLEPTQNIHKLDYDYTILTKLDKNNLKFPQIKLTGNGQVKDKVVDLNSKVLNESNTLLAHVNISSIKDNHKIKIQTVPLEFSQDKTFQNFYLKDFPLDVDITEGALQIKSIFSWHNNHFSNQINIKGQHLNLSLFKNKFIGTNLNFHLKDSKFKSLDDGFVQVKKIEGPFIINDTMIDWKMNPSNPVYGVLSLKSRIFGGTIEALKVPINLNSSVHNLNLKIKKLNLDEVFEKFGYGEVYASGFLSGNVPVMLKDRQINIKDGDLHATTPGEFHYVKNSTIYNSMAKSDNEAVRLLNQILSTYKYNKLNLNFDYQPEGLLLSRFRFEGYSKNFDGDNDNIRVNLNVNIQDNILQLMKSIRMLNSNYFEDQINDNLKWKTEESTP